MQGQVSICKLFVDDRYTVICFIIVICYCDTLTHTHTHTHIHTHTHTHAQLSFSPNTPASSHAKIITLVSVVILSCAGLFMVCAIVGWQFGFNYFTFLYSEVFILFAGALHTIIRQVLCVCTCIYAYTRIGHTMLVKEIQAGTNNNNRVTVVSCSCCLPLKTVYLTSTFEF